MNELNSEEIFTDNNNNTNANHVNVKLLYQELADKEQALILAAQFGKNLIEEKEDLEKQIDSLKREQQSQIESLEQESYELKRLIESMRNEYEAKIYELNEDLLLLNRKLVQKEQNKTLSQEQNEQIELIHDLNEKNQKLTQDYQSIEMKYSLEQQNTQQLEKKLNEKEKLLQESSLLLANFQKEINQLLNKQQELDYALMQTCNERDKQTKLIEDLTNKYLFLKNEKNDLEHLIYQHENELFNLRRANQELLFKYEKLESLSITVNRKRRSTNSTLKKSLYSNSNYDHFFSTSPNTTANKKLNFSNASQFSNAAAYLFDKSSLEPEPSEFQDIEEDSHDLDIFKMNEIEQDDEDEDIYFNQFNSQAVNWQQETIEHSLNSNTNSTSKEKELSDDEESSNQNKTDQEEDESSLLSKISS